jgi:hypothetical protein
MIIAIESAKCGQGVRLLQFNQKSLLCTGKYLNNISTFKTVIEQAFIKKINLFKGDNIFLESKLISDSISQ